MSSTTDRPLALRPPVSVVIPVRNEEKTLEELHRRLREVLPEGSEIVFVDNASDDGSARVLGEITARDQLAVALRLRRPFGKSAALAAGFERGHGAIVATIDADLQEAPEEIPALLDRLSRGPASAGADDSGYDVVTGWRRRRQDPPLKVAGSRLFNMAVRWLSGVPLRDVNCGLKVLRREVVEAIPMDAGYHRFIPLLAHWKGFRVGEVEVGHAPRRHGASRYGRERILHGLIDLVVLLFLERFERRPSRFFLGVGSVLLLAGFLISLFIAWLKLTTGTIQSRYPLLALGALLMVVGTQLASMGFLAELVARQRQAGEQPDEPVAAEIPRRGERAVGGERVDRVGPDTRAEE